MSSSQQEILFFETIAHDGEIELVLQVDEIKFEQPVYVDEIRILPAGYNVTGLEKSTIRTGATKPLPCELEFFGKNLNARTNRDRVRYRRLGKKVFRDEYDIIYYPSLSIPTDSLIVKGKYDTLTIAVIGVLARPKSPPPRHEPPSTNKQIVDFLQAAVAPHRPHPMDTLPMTMGVPSNTPPNSFSVPSHSHSSSTMETASSSSESHIHGVWVAPPEQSARQTTPTPGSYSHLSSQRPVQPSTSTNFVNQVQQRVNDEHVHEYNQPSYPPRLDERSQPIGPPSFSKKFVSSNDFPHADKNLDEIDEKGSRMPTNTPQYRPNLSDHIVDDSSNAMVNPNISYLSQQNSFSSDSHRRAQEILSTSINSQQENRNDADSYESDDNTSESETSSVQGIFFTEEEHEAMKRNALYNTRGSTRSTTLKAFPSPIKSPFEIEREKFHPNENLADEFRKLLSNVSIDHCNQIFLESFESICHVLPMALASLNPNDELIAAIERLTDWASKLIQLDYIITKQFTELDATLLKIRIMKCGIRLSGHLSVLTEEMSDGWIKSDFQSKLLDLYDDPCVAPSVKSLILKILDQSLFFKSGLQWFTGQHVDFPLTTRPSPYFRLIEKLQLGTELKKLMSSISCLIRKVHLHEEFYSFQCQMKSLSSEEHSNLTNEQAENRKKTFDDLLLSLATIRDVLINSNDLISQEKSSRIAPCQSIVPIVFSKISNEENSWPCLLRWMIDTEFLQCLTVLIHLTILNQRQDLFNVIEEILREFFNSFDALVCLAHQTTICTELSKSLYFAETKFEDSNNDPVGPQLRCALQTLNCLDDLKTCDNENELVQILHHLLSLIFFHHYLGKLSNKRRIIVRVLSMNSNLEILLNLIETNETKNKIRTRYVARILYEIFATADSVVLIEKFGKKLLNLCEKHSNQRLIRLRQWLTPLIKLNDFQHSEENVNILIKELQNSLNESTQTGDLPASLMTNLRLIQYFSIPPDHQFVPGAKIELKYDFMLLKFFSHGIYSLLIDVLNKCADRLLISWQTGIPLNISDRISTYGILLSALIVFRTLLQKLMFDRKTKFVDLAPIRTLHSIYTVTLCASPSTELTDLDLIRTNIIDSLNAFTWLIETDGSESISVENSAWTRVLTEILRQSASLPYSMTSGLCLLTELLPIPLPHTVRQPLTNNECNAIRDDFHRFHLVLSHIWLNEENHFLSKFVQTLCHTSSSIMQEILRRLSMQLIDLGPKLAKLVMKTLMDELINSCKTNSNETTKTSKFISNDAGRLVAFIATLVSIRSGKCALLSLLNSSEDKYSSMIKDLLDYLHVRAESNETCLYQDATMSILQTLSDANLSLTSLKSTENSLQFLANSLPKSDLISQILTNIFRLLSSTKQQPTWTQTTMALRTLISLAEHDFGLEMLRTSLKENPNVFSSLISQFDLRFDKEQPDYLEAVSALMIFLERLTMIESNVESPFIRTKVCPLSLFKELLGVSSTNETQLEKFIDLINAVVTDDSSRTNGEPTDEDQCVQTLQKILERANRIIQLIKSNENPSEIESNNVVMLPKAESIEIQFQNRSIYILTNDYTDDQRNSELYWLGVPTASLLDDVDYGQDETSTNADETNEKIKCDLEDLMNKYCTTFHFFDEFKKEVTDRIRRKRKSSSKKRSVTVEPNVTNVDTSIITTSASKSRTPWSAPMRGNNRRNLRPNAIGANVHPHNPTNSIGARRADHFRNRPLNTSRPPSMHVDEFEKQFHDGANCSNSGNSSSSNNANNNLNENNNGTNNNNDNDLMSNLSSSNDNGSDRERWPRRGLTPTFRPGIFPHHRYPFLPGHLPYPGGPIGFRERLPYGYPTSRYAPYEMDFHPPYFGADEPIDDRPYDFYPMNMSFDPLRYRGHFSRYDPGGFH